MAQDIVNKNQDISYTNLDFSSIYTEIVDLAKQLSYKWDPSISDESDPGVVLLKLSSLIADKMNYNIDKSVLESFPLSVTQEGNARQLYEQLGYYMNWYESATVPINISYIGSDLSDEVVYTIPKFTIITDSESERSYALIGTVDSNGLVVSDGKLAKDGKIIQMIAMEGTPVVFSFLGETNITSQMVDENNRLYFETKYVSQNGIFIRNAGSDQDNYNDWKRVDNLYEQPYNDLRYKFGIDSSSDVAYIEFPDNYAELIGSGIEIVYMVIDPEFSNIPTKTLDRFLNPLIPVEDSSVSLGTDTTRIENIYSATGHKDVESIDEAYVNYKRTVGTFKTLITLRDYLNFILLEGEELCSNGFVTDRTNDPQLSYKIMSNVNGVDTLITEIESDDEYIYTKVSEDNYEPNKYYRFINRLTGFRLIRGESYDPNITAYYIKKSKEKLTPFSLKFYLLQDAVAVNTRENFEQTFEMIQSEDLPSIDAFIENTSHIQHTYEDILPLGENTYKFTSDTSRSNNKSYYKKIDNRYEFISSSYYDKASYYYIIDEYDDNAYTYYSEMEPGETYYVVYGTKTKDTQIVSNKHYYTYDNGHYTVDLSPEVADLPNYYELSQVQPYKYNSQYDYYYTVAVEDIVPGDDIYTLVDISGDDTINPASAGWYEIDVEALSPHIAYFRAKYPINMAITTYSVVGNDVQANIKSNVLNALYENLNSSQLEFGDRIELDYLTEVVLNADTRIKTVVFDNIDYRIEAIYYDKIRGFVGITLPIEISVPNYDNETSVLSYNICKDIYAKSVLAGVTKLLDKDDEFDYNLNQSFIAKNDNIYSISSEATIDFKGINTGPSRNYTLKENEIVTVFQPKLTDVRSYETGVHYEYLIHSPIIENSSYRLSNREYFVTYVAKTNENGDVIGYTTTVYTNGAIIKPTFNLEAQQKQSALSTYFRTQLFPQLLNDINKDSTEIEFSIDSQGNSYVSDFWLVSIQNDSSINNNVITGSDSVTIQSMSEITIEPSDGYKFYWQLNNIETAQSTGRKFYRLFDSYNSETDKRNNGTINSYTLKSGESLYYMNSTGTNMAVLNEGTTITRNGGLDSSYETVSSDDLISYLPVTETVDDETILRTGINLIQSSENGYVPTENGLYEEEDGVYILSTDSNSYSVSELTSFYVLVMNSTNGFYENKGGTYVPTESITYDVFEQVNTENMDIPSIDPSESNYYEQITYNNIVIEDTYIAGDTTASQENLEGSAVSRPRYKKCTSTNVLDENIFTTEYTNFIANDISTYPLSDSGDITINNSTAGIFSPSYNNLYEADVSDEYYNFYIFSIVNDPQTTSGYYEFNNGVYTLTTDDSPQESKTYYAKNAVSSITANSIPVQEGWYEEKGATYQLTNKIYPYKPTIMRKSTASYPFIQIDLTNYNGNNQPIFNGLGCYYKVGSNDTIYKRSTNGNKYVPISNTSNDLPENLLSICRSIKVANASSENLTLSAVDSNWNSRISISKPSEMYIKTFTIGSSAVGDYDYYYVSASDFMLKLAQLSDSITPTSYIYPWVISSSNEGYIIDKNLYNTLWPTSKPSSAKGATALSYEKLSVNNGDKLLNLWYDIANIMPSKLTNIVFYIEPVYYRMRYLFGTNVDNLYTFKTYVDKIFPEIAPWECEVITNDLVVNDPANALKKVWRTLQDNCSITIRENDSYTLTSGDTLTVFTGNSASNVSWPTLTNTEIILNLDNYNVSYTKSNNEITTLNKVTIPGSDWRAYSNLLINTSVDSGQVVYPNHSVIFNDSDDNRIITLNGADYDVAPVFQLKYPINNVSGDNIQVFTYDDLGNIVPNHVYVYEKLVGEDNKIEYSSDGGAVLTFKDLSSGADVTEINLPFNHDEGEYLIPLYGIDGVELSCEYLQNVFFETTDDSFVEGKTYYEKNEDDEYEVTTDTEWDSNKDYYEMLTTTIYDFSSGIDIFNYEKTYYLHIVINENDVPQALKFMINESPNKDVKYTLGDLFKFVPVFDDETIYNDLLDKVKSLDNNNIFNYTYQPDSNDLIANPLDPKMFWNKNHIYNKNTIAQLDTSSSDNINYRFITSR